MKEISREEYISKINPEKTEYLNLNLIITEESKVYLRADIENEEDFRMEMMYFEMDTSLNFLEANSECRDEYSGGIYLEIYEDWEEGEKNIINDFMNLYEDDNEEIIYLLCREDDLKNILPKYKNKFIYVMTDFEIEKQKNLKRGMPTDTSLVRFIRKMSDNL